MHLAEAEPVRRCQSKNAYRGEDQAEPAGLVQIGFLRHRERNTGTIPHAIAVGGANPESVRTDRNVGVDRGERIVGLQPERVYIVHPILEANLFWPCQRNGIEMKLDVMGAGR